MKSSLSFVLSAILNTAIATLVPDTSPTITTAEALITPAAVLETGRQDSTFIGYYSASGKEGYAEFGCMSGYTWSTTATFGECCPRGEACAAMTACTSTNGEALCELACNSHIVLERVGDTQPTYWIGCDDERETATYYRTMPGPGVAQSSAHANASLHQPSFDDIYYKSVMALFPGAGLILAVFIAIPRYLGATRLSRPRVMSIRRS